jgi:hypothetical protein
MKDPMQRLFEKWFVEKMIKAGYKCSVNPEAYEEIKQTSEKEKPPYKYHGVTIEESE